MDLELPIPDYPTVCRRQAGLTVEMPAIARARHVVVDSTGLKVYGAGEWHRRKHGAGRRRTWRKLHLGVDETTKETVAEGLTASNTHDSTVLPALLDDIEGVIRQVSGDAGYDTRVSYEAILDRGAVPTIIPRRNARRGKPTDEGRWRVTRD
jgi:hypothetical protein